MTVVEQQPRPLFNGAPELHLTTATELIQSPSGKNDRDDVLKALNFLRYEAIAHRDIEAKTKLCTIYSAKDSLNRHIQADEREAEMWSRSVFDKQLSDALYSCANYFTDQTTRTSTSTIDLILEGAKQLSSGHVSYLAGLLLTKAIGVERDLNQGVALLQHASEQGLAEASYELGRVYGDRYSYSLHDTAKSMELYQRAVQLGDDRAYVDLAYAYYVDSNNLEKAFEYASEGAKLTNDRYCQYILGHLYLGRNQGNEAIQWLAASAQQDFALAIEELAAAYFKGQAGIKTNYDEVLRWCTKGSDIPYCQTALGDLFRNGWGVDRDYQRAFQYYQTAASQPEAPNLYAQHMLGEMFLNGEGIPQDTAVAKEYFQIAASQGYEASRQKVQVLEFAEQKKRSSQSSYQQQQQQQATQQQQQQQQQPQQKKSNRWSINLFGKNRNNNQ
ncbi:hypothetical protein BDB00DRAFT_878128 [Zychaea mexicana]|uniref:uncharacterized protein n=1 Tax=Zychaea mexicana TaxID=64656 RepID=UPI0022FF45DA|nr:uncharacterized protein BDB00DRAFT_878128 [Zychaea mexicana]KAI9485023.1 hypothetical protein BDB00DRAFT_878128 [Zychaea mexicana]